MGSGYYGANGTVDLTKYTGPLSIGTLQVGDGYSGSGQFTFGNATNNQLTFPSLTINNGSLNVNSGATLAVSSSLTLGYANECYNATAALNLAAGAALHVGTAGTPASMTVASHANGGCGGVTTATFAPDSSVNPDITLYLSTLRVGSGEGTNGTVDLTKYTGPLSIGTLQVGDAYSGRGQFTFGNAAHNQLTFSSLTINNGSLNVNSGATLAVSSSLTLGYANECYNATAALNLAAGAALHVGTPGTPASMTVASHANGGCGGVTTATFAPDSSVNPDMTLYLSTLRVGSGEGTSGIVDLTKYTGPLSIGTLQVGDGNSGRGQFTFGNATNNQLTFSSLTINNGSLNVNSGATLAVTGGLTVGSGGSLVAQVGGLGSGLSLDNPANNALSLGGGAGRIWLDFGDPAGAAESYWGLRWEGDHEAYLASLLDEGQFSGTGQIQVAIAGSSLNLDNLDVGITQVGGVEYTYIGFGNVPEPSTLTLLAAGTVGLAGYGWRQRRKRRGDDHSVA